MPPAIGLYFTAELVGRNVPIRRYKLTWHPAFPAPF